MYFVLNSDGEIVTQHPAWVGAANLAAQQAGFRGWNDACVKHAAEENSTEADRPGRYIRSWVENADGGERFTISHTRPRP